MVSTFLRWRRRHREPSRVDVLLAVLYAFDLQGLSEVSLSEVTESIVELQESTYIGYEFPEGLFYCYKLSEELRDLQYSGYLHAYEYRHDGFLPNSFVRLSLLGKDRSRRVFDEVLTPFLRDVIRASVIKAIERYVDRWGLFARKRDASSAH